MNFRKYSALRSSILLAIVMVAAFAFWLHRISAQSVWFDEGWSAFAAAQPGLVAAANADATNPPLYYALLHVHARFLGDSEFSLRVFSAFCGLLVIAASFHLTRRLVSRQAALLAAAVVAFNPLMLWAAQEARMYTLLALLVLAAATGFHAVLRGSSRGWWLMWSAELALLYAHNSGPVVAIWLNGAALTAWVVFRSLKHPDWKLWLAGQAAVGVLWLPYFITRFVQLGAANAAVESAPTLTPEFLFSLWRALWEIPWERIRFEPFAVLSISMFVIWLIAVVWQRRRAAVRWLVWHSIILTAALIMSLAVLGNELHGRYLVMIAPLALIPLGAWMSGWRPAVLQAVGVTLLALALASAVVANVDSVYRHDDARGMVQYYADTLTADDSVVAWSYADRYELAYYWDRLGVAARRVTLPEGADLDVVVPLLPTSGDVALNIWFTQRADFRGMLTCLFADGTRDLPTQHTVHGMTNLLFQSPALEVRPRESVGLDFGPPDAPVVRVTLVTPMPDSPPDEATCLPLEMELVQPVSTDLKAALIVRNSLGWEIARADAVFATANQRQTSQLSAGELTAAFPLLHLPYGAPAGEYAVYLRIYDEDANLSGLEPPRGRDTVGRDMLLGRWIASGEPAWQATNRAPELTDEPIAVEANRELLRLSASPADRPLVNGETLQLELLWRGQGPLPPLMLANEDGRWSISVEPEVRASDGDVLDWRAAVIPPDAETGRASLQLPGGDVLAVFEVASLPLITSAPQFEQSAGAGIGNVGVLVGFSLPSSIVADEPAPIQLVWRATQPSDTPLTVFVQLVDEANRVVAQSDRQPASGTRPTTGWRPGEYIVDDHVLTWNALSTAPEGTLRLIAGLYDPLTGERVLPDQGTADAVLLAEDLQLNPA